MNKMVKGAIATGVGVILLVGGGGTLATWNQDAEASMGSVVAGDLNLAAGTGSWMNAAGAEVTNLGDYKVVPGDTLTYTQPLTVTLTGDLMKAKLVAEGELLTNGFGETATVLTTLTDASGEVLPTTELAPAADDADFTVTATTTFTFKESTSELVSTNASVDLSDIGYTLTQLAPEDSNGL